MPIFLFSHFFYYLIKVNGRIVASSQILNSTALKNLLPNTQNFAGVHSKKRGKNGKKIRKKGRKNLRISEKFRTFVNVNKGNLIP